MSITFHRGTLCFTANTIGFKLRTRSFSEADGYLIHMAQLSHRSGLSG